MSIFDIDYPVTRTVHWRWIVPLTYAGALVAIVFLTVLNVALVGYETISVFQSDFNFTQVLWYHHLMPYSSPKPGSLCDPHLFNVGDQMRTNYNVFEWAIQSIEKSNTSSSGLPYNGTTLSTCDVSKISFKVDTSSNSLDSKLAMDCKDMSGYNVRTSTSFTKYLLPGVTPAADNTTNVFTDPEHAVDDPRLQQFDQITSFAFLDTINRAEQALKNSLGLTPYVYEVISTTDKPCPASANSTDCGSQRPSFTVSTLTVQAQQRTETIPGVSLKVPAPAVSNNTIDTLSQPLSNLLQTIYSVARVDLGIDTPNNFILHQEALPTVLNQSFPRTRYTDAVNSSLYASLNDHGISNQVSLAVSGPASIQAVYLCRSQSLKSTGSLIISVLVAVLSMFTTGWAAYMWIVSTIAKRNPQANSCETHPMGRYETLQSAPLKGGMGWPMMSADEESRY